MKRPALHRQEFWELNHLAMAFDDMFNSPLNGNFELVTPQAIPAVASSWLKIGCGDRI